MTTKVFAERGSDNQVKIRFHPGQMKAWKSKARIVFVLAGSQSGKTSWGPYWLLREIQRKGPGDYLVAAPTYPLLAKKLLPEFIRLFGRPGCNLGRFTGKDNTFTFSAYGCRHIWGGEIPEQKTQIFFCHATNPESLESATCKAAWLDEAGQKSFKLGSWEAIQRRLAINEGRCLITSTPYGIGWQKQLLFDKWKTGKAPKSEIEVINFSSLMNPLFPKTEYYRQKEVMPGWKFRMFYDGIFERPAGVIYGDFDTTLHVVPPYVLKAEYPRYVGIDFGAVNTAAVFLAAETIEGKETGRLFLFDEYYAGGLTAAEHTKAILAKLGGKIPLLAVGGSKSEDQWRNEFRAAGLPIKAPQISEVEVGIDRVIGAIKKHQLVVFDKCTRTLDDLGNYSRETDEYGNPTDKIEDKETYHHADSLRYIVGYLKGPRQQLWVR